MTYTYEIVEDEIIFNRLIKKTDENGKIAFIPFDEYNSDYKEYLKWLEENNV